MTHTLHKLRSTVAMLFCLFMARMFGKYQHSGWDGAIEYARYTWCGKEWIFPTSAIDTSTLSPAQDQTP
jgi:Na+/H+ antiporter NhaC